MSEPDAAKAELRESLRRLVKGLSGLFWGLPLATLVCAQTSLNMILRPFGVLPAAAATGLLLFGVIQLEGYQPCRSGWTAALNQAKMFGLLCVGLSPFVFLWGRLPWVDFYNNMMGLLGLSGLMFLFSLNRSLRCLTELLPDDGLREETHLFTAINLGLIVGVMFLTMLFWTLQFFFNLPRLVVLRIDLLAEGRRFLMLFFVLLPLAMTMTLLWKIKEAALMGVFEQAVREPVPPRLLGEDGGAGDGFEAAADPLMPERDDRSAGTGMDTDDILRARKPGVEGD
jgi:hypothetical protein